MRIVTYNTRGSLGMDGLRSTARIIDQVRSLTPDVVCFQEIHKRLRWSGNEDQPYLLAAGLGRRFLFQPNLHFGLGGYGIGMAVRGVVIEQHPHFLPGGRERRGALEAHIRDVGRLRRLTVFCTHWGLSEEERLQQAEALAGIVGAAQHPLVVCGDLNEAPEGEAVQRFLDLTGLQDAGRASNCATFVSENPTDRIDYILHTPDLRPINVEAIETLASDHLPLLADFEQGSS